MPKQQMDLSNIALHIAHDEIDNKGGDYATWTIRFVQITPERQVQNLSNFDSAHRKFSALKFHCQWKPRKPERGVYAQSIGLRDVRHIERVSEAAELLDILKKAEKVRETLPVSPSTFGQFVALICHGLKITKLVIRGQKVTNSGWSSYDDYDYLLADCGNSVQALIDDAIQKTFPVVEITN